MAWDGLHKYGYSVEAERLAYKWLFLVTKIFTEYNGTVVEKYDVTQLSDSHKVNFDYGNQGLGFKGYAKEGYVCHNRKASVLTSNEGLRGQMPVMCMGSTS